MLIKLDKKLKAIYNQYKKPKKSTSTSQNNKKVPRTRRRSTR